MDATHGLAVILRDAAKTPLLRMRSEISSQPLRIRSKALGEDEVQTLMVRSAATPRVSNHWPVGCK
jgi:hypothetical protein